MKKIIFNGFPLLSGTFDDMTEWVCLQLLLKSDTEKPIIISHINVENYRRARKASPHWRSQLIDECQLIFDGIGMKLGLALQGVGKVPDLNGTDLFPLLAKKFSELNKTVYFLGGTQEVISRAAKNTLIAFPDVSLVGYRNGYFSIDEETTIVNEINMSGAEILLVGRGFPLQEEFSLRNRNELKVSLIWNVGGLFDFVSNEKPRAPKVVRQLRCEWLYRFLLEPSRMWDRNLRGAAWFLLHVLFTRFQLKKFRKEG